MKKTLTCEIYPSTPASGDIVEEDNKVLLEPFSKTKTFSSKNVIFSKKELQIMHICIVLNVPTCSNYRKALLLVKNVKLF